MDSDTFSASDFSSAETSLSSDPAPASDAPVESSAPVDTAAQPGGATTQPAAIATDSLSTEPAKPAGPIPFDVHKTALENARTKAIAEFDQQYGWAKQIPQAEFQQVQQLARTLSADPIQGLQSLIAEIRKNPQYDAQLKSLAARALSQRSGQPAADEQEPQPDLPIQLEDGRVVQLYSAPQQAKREAFLQQRLLAQVKQELQPYQQDREALQAERAAAERSHQIEHFTTTTFNDVVTWPGMESKETQQAVAQELARAQVDPNDISAVQLALNAAYRKVVLPTLHTASRQAVLNDINRQAAASTVNPAHTSARTPKSMDEMTTAEALQHVASQMGG